MVVSSLILELKNRLCSGPFWEEWLVSEVTKRIRMMPTNQISNMMSECSSVAASNLTAPHMRTAVQRRRVLDGHCSNGSTLGVFGPHQFCLSAQLGCFCHPGCTGPLKLLVLATVGRSVGCVFLFGGLPMSQFKTLVETEVYQGRRPQHWHNLAP